MTRKLLISVLLLAILVGAYFTGTLGGSSSVVDSQWPIYSHRAFLPVIMNQRYLKTLLWADGFDEGLTYWSCRGEGNWATTVTFFDDPYYDKAALLIPGDGYHQRVYMTHCELASLPSHWIGLQLEFYICDDEFYAFMVVLDILKDPNCYPVWVTYCHADGEVYIFAGDDVITIALPDRLAHGWHTIQLVANTTDMTYRYVNLDGWFFDVSGHPLIVEPDNPWTGYCPRVFVFNGEQGTTTSIAVDHVMVFKVDP